MNGMTEGGVALDDLKRWRAQLRTFTGWLGRRVRRVEVRAREAHRRLSLADRL